MIYTIIIFTSLSPFLIVASDNEALLNFNQSVINYLEQYGYIDKNIAIKKKNNVESPNIKKGLNFQEFYDLLIDGTLNKETIHLINTPRCSVLDRSL